MICLKVKADSDSLACQKYSCFNTYKIKPTKLTPNILTSYSPYVSKVYQAWRKVLESALGAFKSLTVYWQPLYEKQVIKLYLNFTVIFSIVLFTIRSELEKMHGLNDGQSGEDRMIFFFRDLGLQNHQEITAPWPSCAHAVTIQNAMHFSNALFSFGKTSILKWGNVSVSLEVF